MALYREQLLQRWAWSTGSIILVISLLVGLLRWSNAAFTQWSSGESASPTGEVQVLHLPLLDAALQAQAPLIAHSDGQQVTELILTLTNRSETHFIDLEQAELQIDYRDAHQRQLDLRWAWRFQPGDDRDHLFESGEQLQLTIALADRLQPLLGPQTPFALDLTPPHGPVLTLQYSTPAQLAPTIELP